MPRPLQSLPPEPIEDEDDESRPLLDSEQPSHGTVNINHVVTSDRVVTGNSDPDTTVEDISMIRLLTMLSPLFVLLLLSSADTSIIFTLTSSISATFHSFKSTAWIATAYIIASAVVQPLSGRMTDIFGRKAGLIFAVTFFSLGTLICGLARSSGQLITGRLIAGAGGGCINTISQFVLSDLVPLRQRGYYAVIPVAFVTVGLGLGGAVGGYITDRLNWRWAFYIQLPLILIAGCLSLFTIKLPAPTSDKSRLKRIDFVGVVTLVVSLTLLLLGINAGGNTLPWTHPLILTAIPTSLVFLGLFIYNELRTSTDPIFPITLLFSRTVSSAFIAIFLSQLVYFTLFVNFPIYFMVSLHHSASYTGSVALSSAVGTFIGATLVGVYCKAFGRYVLIARIASVINVVVTICIARLFRQCLAVWIPYVLLFVFAFTTSTCLNAFFVALLASVQHDDHAVVTSGYYTARALGSMIGPAIAAAILQNSVDRKLKDRFGDYPNADDIIRRIEDNVGEIQYLGSKWRLGVEKSYQESFNLVWVFLVICSVGMLVVMIFLKDHVLQKNITRK